MSILVDEKTRVLVQGITGHEGSFHTRQMLDFGTHVVAGVSPGKGGATVHGVPVYDTVQEALESHLANASAVFVPAPRARDAAFEAIDAGLETVVIVTEHIPLHDALQIMAFAAERGVTVVGPNTFGVCSPGKCKIGIPPNHIFRPGRVGVVSRSGTLSYEIVASLSAAGLGESTVVGLGGDPGAGEEGAAVHGGVGDAVHCAAAGEDGTGDRPARFQAAGGLEEELGRELLQRGADVLGEGVLGLEGELVAAAEAEGLKRRVGVVEHLLAQDGHDLLPRGPVAGEPHELAGALEPLHPEIVFPERGPDGPDVELHLLLFVAPAVLDLVDAVSRAPGHGAGAQIAAAVGGEDARLGERRGEERARGVGEVMVHGQRFEGAAEEPDAVAAHAPLGRPAPAVLLEIGRAHV